MIGRAGRTHGTHVSTHTTSPEPVTLGPKEERRARSDRRMLRAAIALLGKHGSVGASLAQIGLDAGYSRGLPAQRFGTKLRLLQAVVDAMEAWFDRFVAARTRGRKGCDALSERIRAQLDAVRLEPDSAVANYHLLVDSIGSTPELAPRIAALQEGYRQNIRSYLVEAREMGELREDLDIDQTVRVILGAISGLGLQALIEGNPERLEEDGEFAAALLIGGIIKSR